MTWRIDLYDTATTPTPAMREAMARAEVGDDVYGEDPTVNRLEAEAAAMIGKEAALFVASGTMGNLIALMVHTQRGEEVILEEESHIFYYETGGMASLAGLMPRPIRGEQGLLSAASVRAALRDPHDDHIVRSRLVCVENTHNRAGGTVTPPEIMHDLRSLCQAHGLRLHLDGARIFHAAVALDLPVDTLTQDADTVMFCLSKGLGAPIGSILAGEATAIDQARRIRKMLGGGMRQLGVVAAAGLVALHEGPAGLKRDHALARELALELSAIPGLNIDLETVQTNIVMVDTEAAGLQADDFCRRLQAHGINVSTRPPYMVRMVTHHQINASQIQETVQTVSEILHTFEPGR